MAIYTVIIAGVTPNPEVYGGLPNAIAYLTALLGPNYTSWLALVEDDRERTLVGATRYIDRQRWRGAANAFDSTTLQFPRSGITDTAGVAITNATQLAAVEKAVFELSALAASDPDIFAALDQGQNIRSMGAGSARLEFFSPTKTGDGTATKLPTIANDLIGQWLLGSGPGAAIIGGTATGTDGVSTFGDCDDFERSRGF